MASHDKLATRLVNAEVSDDAWIAGLVALIRTESQLGRVPQAFALLKGAFDGEVPRDASDQLVDAAVELFSAALAKGHKDMAKDVARIVQERHPMSPKAATMLAQIEHDADPSTALKILESISSIRQMTTSNLELYATVAADLGDLSRLRRAAYELLSRRATPVTFALVDRLLSKVLSGPAQYLPAKVAIVSSFTLDLVAKELDVLARLEDLTTDTYVAPYNQIHQEILDPGSGLRSFAPDVVILAATPQSLVPAVAELPFVEHVDSLGVELIESVVSLVNSLRTWSEAYVVVHNFPAPVRSPLGIGDTSTPGGLQDFYRGVNVRLVEEITRIEGCSVLDADAIVAARGRARQKAAQKYLARMEIDQDSLPAFAEHYLAYVRALAGRARKCVVVDLDNTLWGGILGEDGPEGIALGPDYPGNTFVDFQQGLLQLTRRGVLLAICSKNNEAEVLDLLRNYPHMVLREEDFAAYRINWDDKVTNLREIADELNLGLDAFVFFDDSPTECEWVASCLPEVQVIELPEDRSRYRAVLDSLTVFDVVKVTDEDRHRTALYVGERRRREVSAASQSLEEFLTSLGITVHIRMDPRQSIPRLSQLTQRTNQFNMTTHRYSENDMATFIDDDDYRVYALSANDRFGEYGIVALAIASLQVDCWELDTFLASCRILGRGVEVALLTTVAQDAFRAGVPELRGVYFRTPKNAPIAAFLEEHIPGFDIGSDDRTDWSLTLPIELGIPPWITLKR